MWEQRNRKHVRRTISVALFFVGLLFAGPALAQVEQYTVGVNGMSCPFCAYGIEKKLKALDGVESLKIHIKEGEVDVHVGEGKDATPKDIKTAIKEAGFELRELHVRGEAEIVNNGGKTLARFSKNFTLPIRGEVSKTGKQTLRGKVVHEQGTWRLAVKSSGGRK